MTGARARERLGGEVQDLPTSLPLSPRPSGVQPCGRELLQEMHPDSRRHVQRRALLSPLQGKGQLPSGRDGSTPRSDGGCGLPDKGRCLGGGAAGGGVNVGRDLTQRKCQWRGRGAGRAPPKGPVKGGATRNEARHLSGGGGRGGTVSGPGGGAEWAGRGRGAGEELPR